MANINTPILGTYSIGVWHGVRPAVKALVEYQDAQIGCSQTQIVLTAVKLQGIIPQGGVVSSRGRLPEQD